MKNYQKTVFRQIQKEIASNALKDMKLKMEFASNLSEILIVRNMVSLTQMTNGWMKKVMDAEKSVNAAYRVST